MPRPQKINEAEWMDELSRLSSKNDSGMTTTEWAERIGKSEQTVNSLLRKAKAKGWLVIGRRTTEALDGRMYQAVVYRIVKPGK